MAKKILIVEDNEMNMRLIREILRYHGYEIIEARNGEEGIAMARELLPDLILMDIQMPVMDGYEAMTKLKADPATQRINVIAISSFAMKGDKEKYLAAGFDDYITKPIDTRQIPDIIKKRLGED